MDPLYFALTKSLVVISLCTTLMIYHLFIYIGRKEYYYLEFSLFIFCVLGFIFSCFDLRFLLIKSKEINNTILPIICGVAFAGMMHFIKNIFSVLFSYHQKNKLVFLPMYLCLALVVTLSCIAYIANDIYNKYILYFTIVFATIGSYYMLGVFLYWLVKSKMLLKNKNLIIIITFILACVEMSSEASLYLLHMPNPFPFSGTYLFTGISIFTWSFILADKFNREHYELKLLKQSLEEKIIERTKELEIAIETRTNTFINLAHEIKTPLTLINSYLGKCITKYGDSFEMNIIKDNVDKLARDITNSFIEEKFRKGIMPEDNNFIINLSNILTDRSIAYSEMARKKNIVFEVNIEDNILIKAHPNTMDSIINNLVENAIKYIPENSIIFLNLYSKNDKTILIVKDNGNGIPVDLHNKIFEPGFQISGKKQNYQGIGMGLYIVKMMVSSIGGTIKIKSEENHGTEFIIELNKYLPTSEDLLTEYSVLKPSNISIVNKVDDILNDQIKHSILIVEDNSQMLQYLANELKQYFNIYVSQSGKEALERLKEIPRPDLILSDVMMDNMDGFQFLEIIAKMSNLNSIPLIFLTAKSTESDKLNGLNLGAVDYIYKPFKIDEIISKALSIVNKSDQQKRYLAGSVTEFLANKFEIESKNTDSQENKFFNNCIKFNISRREKEIVKLLSDGLTYKTISEKLFISEYTVAKHVQNLYDKTGIKNRTDLLSTLFN